MSDAGDDTPFAASGSARPIVGLGASAGGVEAFREFLRHTPAATGMAFVLLHHHDARQPGTARELLQPHTSMAVRDAAEGMFVEPNHVYVSAPGRAIGISGGRLRMLPGRAQRSIVNAFFRELAEDQGHNAVGVVLYGIGSDGIVGLRAIRERGGLTLAQAPETARYDAMPRRAVETGVVDEVLGIERMPARLAEYAVHLRTLDRATVPSIDDRVAQRLGELLASLRQQTGHDFSRYKKKTLARRILRRLQVEQLASVDAYLDLLARDRLQAGKLARDLLVGVTQFFRDAEAFDALKREVFAELVRDKPEDIRIWVPGCSTGEEAYSLGILLHEAFEAAGLRARAQIFATDLDDRALEQARAGRYCRGAEESIGRERLAKYFVSDVDSWVVDPRIREMCIFSQHDLMRDPPFSRLDLVSCRNVLIYFEPEVQQRVLELFHYSLGEGGRLFLGPSERLARSDQLFRPLDKRHRIFTRKPALSRARGFGVGDPRQPRRSAEPLERRPATLERGLPRVLENVLLDEIMPATMLVDAQGDVVYIAGRTGKVIEPPTGALTLSAVNLVHRQLRPDLRAALHESMRTREVVQRENLVIETSTGPELVDLAVRPLTELADADIYAVVFRELGSGATPRGEPAPASDSSRVVQQLESELRSTREHLQTTIEELETSNEELKSSNEELVSMNEELLSLNEDFETVNSELKRKIEDLDELNSDLDNLLRSTQIPTLFLDDRLRIRRFTPATANVFHVIDSDLGRPITDLAARFPASFLAEDAHEVLRTLAPREREIQLDAGPSYVMRITPYRTVDNVIDGVVIAFIEITFVKQAAEQRARLAAVVESASEAIIAKTLDGTIVSWNRAAEAMYGYMSEEIVGKNIAVIVPPERSVELESVLERIRRGERVPRFETERVRKDGRRLTVSLTVSPVLDASGHVIGASAIARDITEQQAAERALRASEQRYRSLVAASAAVVWSADAQGAFMPDQPTWEHFTGQTREELRGWGWLEAVHPDDRERVKQAWRQALAELSSYEIGFRIFNAARRAHRHVLARAVPVVDDSGRAREWIGMLTDVTGERETLDALRSRADELRAIFESSAAGLVESDTRSVILRANVKFAEMTGHAPEELAGKRFIDLVHPDDRGATEELFTGRPGAASYSGERRLISKTGQSLHVQLSASVISGPGGAPERVIVVLQDITESKLAHAELTRAKQAAEDASRAKDQFLAVLSHELRTPLTPVLAAAHKLERTEQLSEAGKSTLRMIRRNAELEARLIDDLLDLTRISRGRMQLRPEIVDASTIMLQALEIVSTDIDAKNLRVESKLDHPCHVKADTARLQQVFWNLLKNAIKFTPPGGLLSVTCRSDGDSRVVAEVRDTGVGIEPALLPHVFDAFEQGTRAREGLGLGLTISRALIDLHGGQLTAESAGPGRGATFRVALPESRDSVVPTPPRHTDTPHERRGSALNVLLVEDHADSAQLMRELLELSGHRVEQAASLAEALLLAESNGFDLLLSDLGLPDGSGLDLVRRLLDAGKVRHAIALSGYGMEDDVRRSREAGFEEHLVKPVSPRELDATIRRVTRHATSPRTDAG